MLRQYRWTTIQYAHGQAWIVPANGPARPATDDEIYASSIEGY